MTTKKTPTKQSKKDAKAAEKAKNKKAAKEKSVSKGKSLKIWVRLSKNAFFALTLKIALMDGQMTHPSLKALTRYLTLFCFCIAPPKKAKDADKPEKKTRKKKDADAPKKPMSAFFWYQKTRREPLK